MNLLKIMLLEYKWKPITSIYIYGPYFFLTRNMYLPFEIKPNLQVFASCCSYFAKFFGFFFWLSLWIKAKLKTFQMENLRYLNPYSSHYNSKSRVWAEFSFFKTSFILLEKILSVFQTLYPILGKPCEKHTKKFKLHVIVFSRTHRNKILIRKKHVAW